MSNFTIKQMLGGFNEGRSKSSYCIAATVLDVSELEEAILTANRLSSGLSLKEKAKVMHSVLDKISAEKGYLLKLRH